MRCGEKRAWCTLYAHAPGTPGVIVYYSLLLRNTPPVYFLRDIISDFSGISPLLKKGPGNEATYPIARNFRGLKFSRLSRINDEPRKFYSPKILPMVNLHCARTQSSKIKSRKVWARLIRENFSPRKFLAIRYIETSLVPRPHPLSNVTHIEKWVWPGDEATLNAGTNKCVFLRLVGKSQ